MKVAYHYLISRNISFVCHLYVMVKGSKFFLCNLDFDFIKLLGLFLYLHLNDRLATGLIMIYLYKCHGIIANAEKIIQFVTIMME